MKAEQPKTPEEWEAYYDAQTIIQATLIKQDKARAERAKAQMEKIVTQEKERYEAAKRASKIKL